MNSNIKISINDLIIATKILVNENIIDGFGHASVRNPSQADCYFMTRDNFNETNEENDIIALDLDGNTSANGIKPSLERFIHSEIYRARPDVNAIIHTHSPAEGKWRS